jgi:hypothetical protein
VSAVLVVIIVGAELLARWCAPDYLVRTRGFHVFSETYGWVPRKGASVVIDGKRVSFNARGFRGRDFAIPKAGDWTRVVVLGDSIAFGLRVSDEETFTHLLDVRDNGIEAANLAVQGYGPGQELLVLMREGLRLDPDVVILAFCLGNDFADALLQVSLFDGKTPKPRFRLLGGQLLLDDSNLRLSGLRRMEQFLADESHLFNLVSGLTPRRDAVPGRHWRERYDEALSDEEYALQLNLALVRRISTLCRQRDVSFLVAAFPDRESYGVKPPLAERFFSSLETEGITVLDMSVPFRAVGSRIRSVAVDGTGHLSPLGHTLTAEVFEAHIRWLREARGRRRP